MDSSIVEKISSDLKKIVDKYESEAFLCEIAELLTYLGDGPIPYEPFCRLHSPLRQIFYIAALNICSSNKERKEYNTYKFKDQREDWDKIISILYQLDDAYEEIFIDEQKLDSSIDLEKIKAAYPSFVNYYYSGILNYEEQVIERIERYFNSFDKDIIKEFGLSISDFINIYNIIDEELHRLANKYFELVRENDECRNFVNEMYKLHKSPRNWEMTKNEKINELIVITKNQSEKLKIIPENIYSRYSQEKIDRFLRLFLCNNKIDDNFLLFSQPNILFNYPLYELSDGRILIIEIKQLIYAIYYLLFNFCINDEKLEQRFYKHRGNELEIKIEELFKDFLGKEALIYRNYKTKLKKGQDVLVYIKGLILIIEAKSSKKDKPIVNVNGAFNQVKANFKEIFQKGYEQTKRVEELFLNDEIVAIFNSDMKQIFEFRTKHIHHVFSIIVTLEKFSQIQTDLSTMLSLNDDYAYPYSICIDDLEILLLTMKKEKFSLSTFIKFLKQRELFHGRLDCKDELELAGHFFYYKELIFPPGNEPIVTDVNGTEIFDKFYEKGLGFKNEKNLDRKQSGLYRSWPDSSLIRKIRMNENIDYNSE